MTMEALFDEVFAAMPEFQPKMKIINPQLDRIEAKLDKLLALLEKPKREPRKAKDRYGVDFEACWSLYPKRAGSNPKAAAFSAFQARLKEGEAVGDLIIAIRRYKRFCEATGKVGTEYVMQAARFLGPRKEYEQDWAIPEQATQPKTDDEWVEYGRKLGKEPWPGESMAAYKQRLTGERK